MPPATSSLCLQDTIWSPEFRLKWEEGQDEGHPEPDKEIILNLEKDYSRKWYFMDQDVWEMNYNWVKYIFSA